MILKIICLFGLLYFSSQNICATGCLTCDQATSLCSVCDNANSYYLNNGTCLFVNTAGCQTILSNGECQSCNNGYTLTADYTCRLILNPIPFCLTYSAVTGDVTCLECGYGYLLQNNSCVLEIQNCVQYSADHTYCIQCASGMVLSDFWNQCFNAIANCSSYQDNVCVQCQDGFTLNSLLNLCNLNVPNCLNFSSDGSQCLSCVPGFQLLSSNFCSEVIYNCSTYDSTGHCLTCIDNYFYNPVINECSRVIRDCESYNQNGSKCVLCNNSATSASDKSFCNSTIPRCDQMSANGYHYCLNCQTNYFIDHTRTICYKQDINCQVMSTLNDRVVCEKCKPDFTYDVANNVCVANNKNCDVFENNSSTICQTCSSGYSLSSSGECATMFRNCLLMKDRFTCQTCANGFTFDPVNGGCYVLIANCLTYDPFTSRCAVCSYQFILSNNVCVTGNITCPSYMIASQGTCVTPIDHCAEYTLSLKKCIKCNSGYVLNLSHDYCYTAIPSCISMTSDKKGCLDCLNPFVFNPILSSCLPYNSECSQVNSVNGQCLQCNTGFYLVSGFCIQDNNCQVYDNAIHMCTLCASGYQYSFIMKTCVILISHCTSYSVNSDLCIYCETGYSLSLDKKSCNAVISNCLLVSSTSQCLLCNNGYFLANNNSQCLLTIPNCESYTSNYSNCFTCNTGYFLNTSNQCVLSIDYCQDYNNSGNCLNCIEGYFLSPNENYCILEIHGCLVYQSVFNKCSICQTGLSLNSLQTLCN